MNWKEKLRKECEHLNEVSGFYSFSVMQIQQDKEYFGRIWWSGTGHQTSRNIQEI